MKNIEKNSANKKALKLDGEKKQKSINTIADATKQEEHEMNCKY
jgi:hypothetical protein